MRIGVSFYNLIYVVGVVLVVLAATSGFWRRRKITQSAFEGDSSVLLSYYTISGSDDTQALPMASVYEGLLRDGSYYNVIHVGDQLMYAIQLTFQTEVHMLAIARVTGVEDGRLFPNARVMKQVDLEGDFPDYFHLYVSADGEKQVRYVLDPEAMADVVDFCKTNSWELLNDELYIVTTRNSEQIVTLDAIQNFIMQITPVVAIESTSSRYSHRMNSEQQHLSLKANCPICGERLLLKSEWHECPQGHGYLLTGAELAQIRKQKLNIPDEGRPDDAVAHRAILCPVCGNKMAAIQYANGHTTIDTCSNCQYRWLDGGEQLEIAR